MSSQKIKFPKHLLRKKTICKGTADKLMKQVFSTTPKQKVHTRLEREKGVTKPKSRKM